MKVWQKDGGRKIKEKEFSSPFGGNPCSQVNAYGRPVPWPPREWGEARRRSRSDRLTHEYVHPGCRPAPMQRMDAGSKDGRFRAPYLNISANSCFIASHDLRSARSL
jgi:hypothetical protein